jgi:hypothetical protein
MPDKIMAVTHALLQAVDSLPDTANGAFVVTGEGVQRGMVFAEGNRVCWAAATGLRHRLRELLADTGDEPARRAALYQHSIESLISLCDGGHGDEIVWVPNAQPLRARTTFATTVLLAAVGARLYANEAESASCASIHPTGASGASFAIDEDGDPVIVREVEGDRLGVATLLELGTWATAALEATHGFSPAVIERAIASASAEGGLAIGWRSGRRVVHAAIIEDRSSFAWAVSAMESRKYPVVVSSRFRRQ